MAGSSRSASGSAAASDHARRARRRGRARAPGTPCGWTWSGSTLTRLSQRRRAGDRHRRHVQLRQDRAGHLLRQRVLRRRPVTDRRRAPTRTPTGSPSPSGPTLPPRHVHLPVGRAGRASPSVNAWGQNGTTGGAGGPTVEVDTAAEFLAAIAQPGPLNICVNGMITLPGPMHDVTSNKTIVGVGANSGFTGGGLNIGLPIERRDHHAAGQRRAQRHHPQPDLHRNAADDADQRADVQPPRLDRPQRPVATASTG